MEEDEASCDVRCCSLSESRDLAASARLKVARALEEAALQMDQLSLREKRGAVRKYGVAILGEKMSCGIDTKKI